MYYDQISLHDQKMRVVVALDLHGAMMGISCDSPKPVKSLPQPTHVPYILHPTPLQMLTPHHSWIDEWPFPRFRDNMILLGCVLDTGELIRDFNTMTAFTIKEGQVSWDPRAWQIDREFEAKWGYLFY